MNDFTTEQSIKTPRDPQAAPRVVTRPAAVSHARSPQGGARWVVGAATLALLGLNAWGAQYYLSAPSVRVRHPLHAWLRPSGVIGQSAGIAAFLIFAFLWLYPLRKKWRRLAFTGAVGKWLNAHVAAALVLPLLLLTHAAWRADGMIGLGLDAMFVVIVSGVVGRYLYARIPRAKSGVELTREEVAGARGELLQRLTQATGLSTDALDELLSPSQADAPRNGVVGTLQLLILNDFTRRRRCRELRRRWATLAGQGGRALAGPELDEAVALADREMALTQQARMLEATQRVFRYWHVAHRPFAVTALVAVLIHLAVVVSLGATWFW